MDSAQQMVAQQLDKLGENLRSWQSFRRSLLGAKPSPPEGVYLWGDVGRGKTMLMDRFFAAADIAPKRRVHFNAFMAEAHARIHAWRKKERRVREGGTALPGNAGNDPIAPVARTFATEARLLCLDEFQVRDVADAMILGRLFEQLLARDVIVFVTSNIAPGRLYDGGLNRQLFLPFIDLIEKRLKVIELQPGPDYRHGRMAGLDLYATPLGPAADAAVERAFLRLANGAPVVGQTLSVLGRNLAVRRSANGIARFSFAEICGAALGAADYLAIARNYDVLVIEGIPVFGPEQRDEARRFVVLIDTLYDEDVKLVCSAAAPPSCLYTASEDAASFRRTASRLVEMQSSDYLRRSRSPSLPRAGTN